MDWLVAAVCRCDADTVMADAFRRALGIVPPPRRPKPGAIVQVDERDPDILECFENRRRVRI